MSKFAHETTEVEKGSLSKEEIFEILQKYSYIQDSTEVIAPQELSAHRELWNRANKFGATSEAFFSAQMQERAQNICTTLNAIIDYLVEKKVGKQVLRLLRDGENGLLRSHLLSERNLKEDDLILFMREFIGYVAMLSDFPEEKRNHALAIFPPIQKSEYACVEGTRDRLQEAVKFLRKVEMTPRERMIFDVHNEIVEEARIKFSPFVYEGNQPHLIPAINYLFGFDDTTKSQAKHTALEIPAEKAWQEILGYRQAFIRKCKERLSGVFEMTRQKRNPTEGSNWTEAGRVLELVGLKPEDIVEESDGQYRWSKEKVVDLFPKMRLESLVTLEPPLSLFDLDAPQKIAALLDSDIGANREMGVDALLLMGREAQIGSSPIQFINTLYALGSMKRGELDRGDIDMGVIELRSLSERFRKSNPSLSNKISVAALSLNPWKDNLSSYMKYLEHGDATQVSISEVFFGNAPAGFVQERIELSSAEELNGSLINLDRVFHNPSRLSNLDQLLHSRHGALSLERAQYIGGCLIAWGIKFQDIEIIQYVFGGFCRTDELDEARLNCYRGHPNLFSEEDKYLFLCSAANKGLTEVVRALINRGAGVDLNSPAVSAALRIAAHKGYVAIVNTLLDGGVSIDLTSQSGLSALGFAVDGNHLEVVKALIEKGASVDLASREGSTALMIAARYGRVAIVNALLDGGASIDLTNPLGFSALGFAVDGNSLEVVKALIEKGASVDLASREGSTALMIAARYGRVAIVNALLDGGANIDLTNQSGFSALRLAASKNHPEVVATLAKRGANLDLVGGDGLTALMSAARAGRFAIVKALLDGGANIDLTTQSDLSALRLAAINNHPEVVAILANRRANLDLVGGDGLTALMVAAREGHLAVVITLLEGGADFNLVNREGRTALMMASREHNEGVVNLLSSYASAFDERRSLGQSISATPTATPNVTASNAVAPASDNSCTIS